MLETLEKKKKLTTRTPKGAMLFGWLAKNLQKTFLWGYLQKTWHLWGSRYKNHAYETSGISSPATASKNICKACAVCLAGSRLPVPQRVVLGGRGHQGHLLRQFLFLKGATKYLHPPKGSLRSIKYDKKIKYLLVTKGSWILRI